MANALTQLTSWTSKRATASLSVGLRKFGRYAYRCFSTDPEDFERSEAQRRRAIEILKAGVAENLNSTTASRPGYFDMQATTPMDPRVLDKMLPLMTTQFGNPHSRTHLYGWEAEEMVEAARKEVGTLVGAKRGAREIFFTSGATESNNLAIKGVGQYYGKSGKKHAITTQIEHKCVLASCQWLESALGWDVTYLPVDKDGLVDLEQLEASIRPNETGLISVMHVNNEIGVAQEIEKIGKICAKFPGVLFHCDAAQSVGKLPVDVEAMNIDLMSLSGHKIYGPKGVGALYVNSTKRPRVRISPLMAGGGQERGMRSGTLAAPLLVGLGEACRVAREEMANDERHIKYLASRLVTGIKSQLDDVVLNGSPDRRYIGNVNLSFAYVEGESLLMSLAPVAAVSSGSACTSASLEPSYVLRAIGVDEDLAHTSLRFGIGRFTTEDEVDECVKAVVSEVKRLREMSPLWELAQEAKVTGEKTKMVWT